MLLNVIVLILLELMKLEPLPVPPLIFLTVRPTVPPILDNATPVTLVPFPKDLKKTDTILVPYAKKPPYKMKITKINALMSLPVVKNIFLLTLLNAIPVTLLLLEMEAKMTILNVLVLIPLELMKMEPIYVYQKKLPDVKNI